MLFYRKLLVVAVEPFFEQFAEEYSQFVEWLIGIDNKKQKLKIEKTTTKKQERRCVEQEVILYGKATYKRNNILQIW